MRTLALLLVLLSPQALRAATIEVPLTGLDGFYENGDLRASGFELVPVPEGEQLVALTLRVEGTTACGAAGCIPPVSFTWGSTQLQSDGGGFSFDLAVTGSEPLILGPMLPFGTFLVLGDPGQGNGSTSYNGFFGAGAAIDSPPPPQMSSPAIVTSATLVIVTAPVPEPGLGSLMLVAVVAAILSRRSSRR